MPLQTKAEINWKKWVWRTNSVDFPLSPRQYQSGLQPWARTGLIMSGEASLILSGLGMIKRWRQQITVCVCVVEGMLAGGGWKEGQMSKLHVPQASFPTPQLPCYLSTPLRFCRTTPLTSVRSWPSPWVHRLQQMCSALGHTDANMTAEDLWNLTSSKLLWHLIARRYETWSRSSYPLKCHWWQRRLEFKFLKMSQVLWVLSLAVVGQSNILFPAISDCRAEV